MFLHKATGCRSLVAQALIDDLNANILAKVPSQGSVGAAGDLALMAHIARTLCGLDGVDRGRPPLVPEPKEFLLINGVSMSALSPSQLRRSGQYSSFMGHRRKHGGHSCTITMHRPKSTVYVISRMPEIGVFLRQIPTASERFNPIDDPMHSICSGPSA